MHEFLVSVVSFLVLVGFIVVLHELGHFAVAKLCGVRVEAFSFGFGPRLFGFKYGDTDYKVCLLPLGGYVKMSGEAAEQNLQVGGNQPSPETDPASDPGSLLAHPRWQRMLIGLAGPAVNLLLTLVLMFVYYAAFNEVPAVTVKNTTVEWVTPGSVAAQSGLVSGDVITSFDNFRNPDWDQVFEHIKLNAGQPVAMTVMRAGRPMNLTLQVPAGAKSDSYYLADAGISPLTGMGPIGVAEVEANTPAEGAGMKAGDAIEAVDGNAFHSLSTLIDYMQAGQGKPLSLTILRNGATLQLDATPAKHGTDWQLGFMAKAQPIDRKPLPFTAAWKKSFVYFKNNSTLVAEVLQRLFTRRLSVSQLMGPVGIAQVAGEVAQMDGWFPKFNLASQISLQLGILNLLPFPILDGGMILMLLIESAMRHDISLAIKERVYTAAFVVLIAFFAFVLFNDVSRLGLFTHFKP
jgi:regulator of sigma E protease